MTRFGDDVKQLATFRLSGQRFDAFIRRWEMNKEPKPAPAPKLDLLRRPPNQPRELEAEEQNYFNTDDEDVPAPLVRTIDPIPPVANALKRKRGRSFGSGGHPVGRLSRPSNVPARPSATLPSLVDYQDEEEEAVPSDAESTPSPHPSPSPSPAPEGKPRSPTQSSTPLPTKATNGETIAEAEDGVSSDVEPGLPPMKRRRDDEDDELFARLAKSKRPSLEGLAPRPASPAASDKGTKPAGAPPAGKQKEEGTPGGGTKKMKLKFGSTALSVTAPVAADVPPTSEPGAKDADTG